MSLKIAGVGKYLPSRIVFSEEIDKTMGKPAGWVAETYSIEKRHFANETETTSFMAVEAAKEAIANSEIEISDIDCIISACAVMEQSLPGTGPLIQQKLGLGTSGCAAFDVNASCLSFLSALDIADLYIKSGRYKNILIVSSDIASIGLNWEEADIVTNFGDGAAAVVVCTSQSSGIIASRLETFSEGYTNCQIAAGGTRMHPSRFKKDLLPYALFQMDGKAAFKLSNKIILPFMEKLLNATGICLKDIDLFIPHQASAAALAYLRRKFDIPEEKLIDIYKTHGNQVAASMPTALYEAIKSGRLKRGDKTMLFGTAAGLSMGGMVLEY
jgi:3-oxoacyl-[acyl-carrier-protein] synthase-3